MRPKITLDTQQEKQPKKYLNIHKDLVIYKNKPFKLREIADNYIESQKEIISIYQSVWTPFVENANSRFWNYWSISPKGIAETYGTVVSSFADNVIAATRLTNNAVSANMELFSTALQQTKDNSRELSRLSINAAKIFNEASNDIATTGISAVETTTTAGSRQRR